MSAEFVSFDFVKKSVTILQILDHYGIIDSFKQKGDSLVGPCPIHGGRHRDCFRVSVSKNCFNCFGQCKAGGNILDLVSRKEGVSIRKAAFLIQEWFRLATPAELLAKKPPASKERLDRAKEPEISNEESTALNMPLPFILKNLDPCHPSIAGLGINDETRQTFGLGFCSKGLLTGYIAIPIHNQAGQLVAYAGRWPGEPPQGQEKYKYPPGFRKSAEVFNLRRVIEAKGSGPLILVKDCLVCIKLWQFGFRRVVAIIDDSLSALQAALIKDVVQPDGGIVVLFDETDAGRSERNKVVSKLIGNFYVKAPTFQIEGGLIEKLDPTNIKTFIR